MSSASSRLCTFAKEESSASSRLRVHRALEDISKARWSHQGWYSNNIRGHLRKRRALQAAGFARTELWRIFPKLVGVTEAGVLTYMVICKRGELASS